MSLMNVPAAVSLSLLHIQSVTYTLHIGSRIRLHSYTHTNRRWLHPCDKKFFFSLRGDLTSSASCREHQAIYRSRVSRRERASARDEEKRERGEKILQLWSKCCTERLCVMGNVTVNASAVSFIYTARVILHDFDLFRAALEAFMTSVVEISIFSVAVICCLLMLRAALLMFYLQVM